MKISAVEHNFSHQPILIPAYPSMGPGVEKQISCLSQSIGIGAHVCEDHKDLVFFNASTPYFLVPTHLKNMRTSKWLHLPPI